MLLLSTLLFSLDFPKCNSTSYPTDCGKLVDLTCTFNQLYVDLPVGNLDAIKSTTIKTCTTECLKQHKAAHDCMLKKENPQVEVVAKTCLKVWNNHCGKVEDKLCRAALYDKWQSNGHNNYTDIKNDIRNNVNDGYECTECQKQYVTYAMAFENYQNQFDGPHSYLGLSLFNLTEDTCGKSYFDGYRKDVESYNGLEVKNATASEKAPEVKTQNSANELLLINLSLIFASLI